MMEERCTDALRLDNQLCFPLYACSREVIRRYKPFLDELDLTYTQYIAMLVLWERRSVTAKELGSCLYLDSGTLTPLLKKLEAKGLLTRRRLLSRGSAGMETGSIRQQCSDEGGVQLRELRVELTLLPVVHLQLHSRLSTLPTYSNPYSCGRFSGCRSSPNGAPSLPPRPPWKLPRPP